MGSYNWYKWTGYKKKKPDGQTSPCGAENETRTRDPNLGKVMLYQLSYFRGCGCKGKDYFGIRKQTLHFFGR